MMDGRTVYSRAKKLIESIDKKEISVDELKTLIMREIGSGERTILSTLHVMDLTGLIKDIGNGRVALK